MIPENIAIVFLVIPIACLIYIFRGMTTEDNPLWGNIISAGLSATVCALVAIWFFSGTIVFPSVVSNATYQMQSGLSSGDLITQQANASHTIAKLGPGGSGMFIRSAISASAGGSLTNQTSVTVYTYDIIYQQFQDFGMMFLYVLLCIVSVALFVWFILEMRKSILERESHDEFVDQEPQE